MQIALFGAPPPPGAAFAGYTVWLVGLAVDPAGKNHLTVVACNAGRGWQQAPAPDPRAGDKGLPAVYRPLVTGHGPSAASRPAQGPAR